MKMYKKTILLFIIVTTILLVNNSFVKNTVNKFENVDEVVETAINDSAFPGAVLLISDNGKIIYQKAFGHYTYDKNSPLMKINTIFDLASVSKVISTTTCTMICFDRGLFKLDDKVSKYIPEFAQNGKKDVTIRNLLVHDSGLRPDIISYKAYANSENPEQDILNEIYSDTLIYPTGTKMVYSDLNMITMAKIIEKITGKTLDQFAHDEIFKPLGMNHTMYNPPASLKDSIAPTETDNYFRNRQLQGEVHDETSFLMGGVAGHAGLFSNVNDLAKFLQMVLNKGSYKGKKIINPETVELFIKQQSELSSRALGWDTKSQNGYSSAGKFFSPLSYGHTGYTGTSVWTDPTKNLFVVLLTNRVYPTRKNIKIIRVRPKVHNAIIKALEN
jgi:CubicO group peptidase (beta-lactamase class C family)